MDDFNRIREKLQQFIKKFYFNELIKGLLLFMAIGVLYFIFTLFVEYFLWLKPFARTLLFWLFVIVEVALFVGYIIFPTIKIFGLKRGLNEVDASKIIGNHFPEVKDKLLNMLQLKNSDQNSELIEASIEQKSKELQPIPFKHAVDFTKNKKYLKFAIIPFFIWLLVFITGNISVFTDSFSRVVHYNKVYLPPTPFYFTVLNDSLSVVEGQPFILLVETIGNTVPENVKINFLNESYYLENTGMGKFQYSFSKIKKSFNFYFEANGFNSEIYQLNNIETPVINNLKMVLQYPVYTRKQNEVVQNTGNANVPQGTKITWQIETKKTNNVQFISENAVEKFAQNTSDYFSYSKQIFSAVNYKITTSNQQLNDYEALNFVIQVIPDAHPQIIVNSDIDSISLGPVQFVGQISDDYGVNKLQMVYYDKKSPKVLKTHLISVEKSVISDFYYVFPEGISLEEGVDYELYFEVFDNDAVNGSKSSKSKIFSYYKKTESEINKQLLEEQKETIGALSKLVEKSKQGNNGLEKLKNEIQKKAEIDWSDTKKLEELLKRQTQYEEMIQKQTNQLQNNLKEQADQKSTKETKEELLKRIEETNKLAQQEKMLEQLKELSKKLDKEDLTEKLKEMAKKNQRNEQSLERILELTKRFYVEQKANQIRENLENLGKKEEELSNENPENNTVEKQQEINKEFDVIKKESKDLQKENQDLKRPMKLPENREEMNDINNELNKSLNQLNEKKSEDAKKSQKSAAKKMKELGKSMEQAMMKMEGESIDENIDDLRKIVDNLIVFSFEQEDLLNRFSVADIRHPEYPNNLKQQQVLKEYFNHIDDSLYVLALRVVQMSTMIQKEVSDVHYNLEEALSNFTDDKAEIGISNQQFVITSTNNLANSLSDLLESMMNASPSFGQGKGKGNSPQFGLPDIIKKQGALNEQMKDGVEKGEKEGKMPGENGDSMNDELYEIYKQQEQLKSLLKDILGNNPNNGQGSGDAVKKMEELQRELLEKGFTKDVTQKILQLNYELLKLQKAKLEQGEDNIRKSETPKTIFEKRNIEAIKVENPYFKTNEILNRQSLPLQTIYKKKVQEYFKTEQQ
ncbi:MAG: hypothetical protein CVU08_01990 [Bacteroidetes bacterium HGW-Bacteroidetes-3]|nr:MAG: hypothetical protein CVU08_01990 [Bacteroidetes bacterium HGW-Bacteroidetes-3]